MVDVLNKKYCLNCGQLLVSRPNKNKLNSSRKFCNMKCSARYNGLKQHQRGYQWSKLNPEKYKKWRKEYYQKTKDKRICEVQTLQMLVSNYKLINKKCKKCGTSNNLEIHHEEYDKTREGIRRLIKEGKIYFLCKEHHQELNPKRIKYPEKIINNYNPERFSDNVPHLKDFNLNSI